jgi:uncharacterized protein YndB with AHSA1/START domain
VSYFANIQWQSNMTSSTTSRTIPALPDAVFRAFTSPDLLVQWQAPDTMTARIREFDIRPGGFYEMSLFYDDPTTTGKTQANEDRYTARIIELDPPRRIVESIVFAGEDPSFATPMTITVDLEPSEEGTKVTMSFENLPSSVSPADNDLGTQQSLAKLARLLERE